MAEPHKPILDSNKEKAKLEEEKRKTENDENKKLLKAAKELLDDESLDQKIDLKIAEIIEAGEDIHEGTEIDIFCTMLGVTYNDYEKALKTSQRGKVLFMKRNVKDRYINNYNPEMLQAWNANMDIQLALDPYAVISYIVSYVNKDETQMTKFLKEALSADAGKNAKERLKTLKHAFFSHRQVGHCEATYRLLPSLKLKDSNISCIFVMTGFPDKRSIFCKKVSEEENDEIDQNDSDSDDGETEEEQNPIGKKKPIKIEGRLGYYQESITVHDRYASRPRSASPNVEGKLEKICLAQFATSYTPISKLPQKAVLDEEGCSKLLTPQKIFNSNTFLPKYIKLENDLGYMRLRTFPNVMRIHTTKNKDELHEKYYSELVLFAHWRNEEIEFHRNDMEKCVAEYMNRKVEVDANQKKMYPGESALPDDLNLEDIRKPEHISDELDCQGEQNNEDDQAEECVDDPEYESFGYPGNLDMAEERPREQFQDYKCKKISLPSIPELNQAARKLIPEQMNVLRKVVASCRDIVKAIKNPDVNPKPVRLIVHGGAGAGKSATIRAVSTQAENILRNAGDDPNLPKVLMCCFAAKAAHLIGGTTYHSAFKFKIGLKSCHMSDKTKAQLRHHLSDLKLLIIDEISMVSAGHLIRIHERLCKILQVDIKIPFANVNVMFVGDLLQLKPVQGRQVFQVPIDKHHKSLHEALEDDALWNILQPMILKHNHRQGEDKQWAETLNRMRVGKVTSADETLLRTRKTDAPFLDCDAMHLFYKNRDVTEHNEKMLKKLTTKLISVKAKIKGNYYISDKKTVCDSEYLETFEFKVGARVMMVMNIDLDDDLYNGAGGTVVGYELNEKKEIDCIIINFDDETCGQNQRKKYANLAKKYQQHNGTPVFKDTKDFQYNSRSRGKKTLSLATGQICQFLLRLYYSSTSHKSQVT